MIKILTDYKGIYSERLQTAANAAAGVLGQKEGACVSFEFASVKEIKEINLRFRGIDKATDVLSFPNLTLKKPQSEKVFVSAKDWPRETDGDGVFLGDIAICKSIAEKQAKEYGHGFDREICYLFIHGLLHLYGFDHETETDKKLMRGTEERIYERYKGN